MQLCEHDIFISDERLDKVTALHRVVEKLSAAGNTTPDYLRGMLDREAQISTYLGNGIAIPHGTPESRDAVLQTGVKVIVFRHGVDWGDGNTAYLVTGIAARSNEHLEILRQLTRVLSDDAILQALAKAESPSQVLALLTGSTTNTPAAMELHEGEQATFVIHIRYYWPHPRIRQSVEKLIANLNNVTLPLGLISQFMPVQFERLSEGVLTPTPHNLIIDKIQDVLRAYRFGCTPDVA